MKRQPLQTSDSKSLSSSPSVNDGYQQTVPMAEEFEAPPPYSQHANRGESSIRPLSSHSHSSDSSVHGEDIPLQHQSTRANRRPGADGYEPNRAASAAANSATKDVPFKTQDPMNMGLTSEQWDSDPGCCGSKSGGCCLSETGGCIGSSQGGCCFSDGGGCMFSSNGGCCFSDNGGCCFSDHGGCCFSDHGGCCLSSARVSYSLSLQAFQENY